MKDTTGIGDESLSLCTRDSGLDSVHVRNGTVDTPHNGGVDKALNGCVDKTLNGRVDKALHVSADSTSIESSPYSENVKNVRVSSARVFRENRGSDSCHRTGENNQTSSDSTVLHGGTSDLDTDDRGGGHANETGVVKEEDELEEDGDLPIDRGWAWVVLAGCFLNIAVMIGYVRALSILFIEYLKVFQASTAKTTLLMGVNSGVYSISALLTMHILVSKLGIRKTLFIGAIVSTIGMSLAIFPVNIDFLIGTHSVLLGIGNSMIFGPSITILGRYFKKRHGLASAVAMSGVSFAASVYPPLVRYLLDEYGLQGTMLILTGLTMNLFVAAFICVEPTYFRKQSAKRSEPPQQEIQHPVTVEVNKRTCENQKSLFRDRSYEGKHLEAESPFLARKRTRTESSTSGVSRRLYVLGRHPDLGSSLSVAHIVSLSEIDVKRNQEKCSCLGPKGIFSALDFSLFKKPIFLLIVCYSFFCVLISMNAAYLPALVQEKGISQNDAALFLTVLGVIDFFCRLFVGFIVDKGYMRVTRFMAMGIILIGTAAQFTYLYNSYASLLGFTVIIGLSTCTYFAVIPVALVELVGLDLMGKTLGFVSLFHGMSVALANPIIGGFRDGTGSYCGAFTYLGVCSYIGAGVLLCEPLVRRYADKKERESSEMDVEMKPLHEMHNGVYRNGNKT